MTNPTDTGGENPTIRDISPPSDTTDPQVPAFSDSENRPFGQQMVTIRRVDALVGTESTSHEPPCTALLA